MKNLIIIALLVFGGHYLYEQSQSLPPAMLDESGSPITLIFIFDGCGKPCSDAVRLVKAKKVNYKTINLSEGKDQIDMLDQYGGGSQMPVLIIGEQRVDQYHRERILYALAETYGERVLSNKEQSTTRNHFDTAGSPVVVMYATKSCGFCAKAEKYFSSKGIEYKYLNIDKSKKARHGFEVLKGSGTPLIYVGYRRVQGFNQNEVKEAIKLL